MLYCFGLSWVSRNISGFCQRYAWASHGYFPWTPYWGGSLTWEPSTPSVWWFEYGNPNHIYIVIYIVIYIYSYIYIMYSMCDDATILMYIVYVYIYLYVLCTLWIEHGRLDLPGIGMSAATTCPCTIPSLRRGIDPVVPLRDVNLQRDATKKYIPSGYLT